MSNYDTSLKRYAESQESDYVEICNCHDPQRSLRFDVAEKEYIGVCGCEKGFACAKLQINKHKIIISSRKNRLLDPLFAQKRKMQKVLKNPNDQTLDKFFGQ
ncbi:MAG: hypothetical protein ACFFDW_01865 [Candidatus Thorarchaeota archaeon]